MSDFRNHESVGHFEGQVEDPLTELPTQLSHPRNYGLVHGASVPPDGHLSLFDGRAYEINGYAGGIPLDDIKKHERFFDWDDMVGPGQVPAIEIPCRAQYTPQPEAIISPTASESARREPGNAEPHVSSIPRAGLGNSTLEIPPSSPHLRQPGFLQRWSPPKTELESEDEGFNLFPAAGESPDADTELDNSWFSDASSRSSTYGLTAALNSDEEIMHPGRWTQRLKNIEKTVWENSFHHYSCTHPGPAPTDLLGEMDPKPGENMSSNNTRARRALTHYYSSRLPGTCPIGCLRSMWGGLRSLESMFASNLDIRKAVFIREEEHGSKACHTTNDVITVSQEQYSNKMNQHNGSTKPKAYERERSRSPSRPATKGGRNELRFHDSVKQLLQSRGVLITICQTIEYLQKNGICSSGISFFAAKDHRTVELKMITLEAIVGWVGEINRTLIRLLVCLTAGFLRNEYPDVAQHQAIQDLIRRNPLHAIDAVLVQQKEGFHSLHLMTELWSFMAQALDLAVISYCGAHIEVGEENFNALHLHYSPKLRELDIDSSPYWMYSPVRLDCLDGLLRGKTIWVLESRTGVRITSPARVLACIEDLADIWGPIWKLVEDADIGTGSASGCYYGIGPGAVVGWPKDGDDSTEGIYCHYLESVAELGPEHMKIDASQSAKLLIGAPFHYLPEMSFPCTGSQTENLCGVKLRPL